MTAEDISSTVTLQKDVTPNLGVMMDVVKVPCTENSDWVEMSNYGYTSVYLAHACVANGAVIATTVSDSTKVALAGGGTDNIVLLVIGV